MPMLYEAIAFEYISTWRGRTSFPAAPHYCHNMQQSGSTLQTRSVKNVCCGKSLIILSCVLYILAATKVFISLLTDARKLEDAIATEKKRLFVDKTKEEKMLHNFTVQPNSANNISVHFINQLAEQERKSSESPQIVQRETRRTNLLVAIHSDEVSSTNLGNATTIEPGPPPLSQQYPKGKISTKDNASLTRANPRTYDVDQGDKALLNSPSWEVLLNLPQCQGKRRLLEILSAAGLSAGNIKARCKDLPLWHQVASLYGEEPIILGLETCAEYRRSVDTNDPRTKRLNGLRIAGLYNSGTNALGKTIVMNMEGQNSIEKDWGDPGPSVPWGKHMPPRYRLSNRFLPDDPFNVMPVVIVRDPYRWLAAMCKAPYDARWQRSPYHCPNLAIADKEREIFGNLTKPFQLALSARQTGFAFTDYYDTLADLWSTFHEEYINATFPRVFVRFEDTIYHAEKVLKALAECVGIRIARKFRYLLDKPKKHGNPSDFVTALVKYGSSQGRFQGMLIEDHKYAQKRFPADFLAALHYSHATVNPLSKRDVPNGTMDILR